MRVLGMDKVCGARPLNVNIVPLWNDIDIWMPPRSGALLGSLDCLSQRLYGSYFIESKDISLANAHVTFRRATIRLPEKRMRQCLATESRILHHSLATVVGCGARQLRVVPLRTLRLPGLASPGPQSGGRGCQLL